MKFVVGDKAVEKALVRAHTGYPVYKIVGTLDGALLAKYWGNGFQGEHEEFPMGDKPGTRSYRSSIVQYSESELFTIDEAQIEIARLEVEKDKVEGEFEKVRASLGDKMNQAAALVQEVVNNLNSLGKNFDALRREGMPLNDALEAGGWRPSNMRC